MFIRRYVRAILLAMLAVLLGCCCRVHAAETVTYQIPLFPKARVFNHAINNWSYWFELHPGMGVVNPLALTLDYTCSGELQPQAGRLTVLLNEYPIASREIPPAKNEVIPWKLNLPISYLKVGYNELRLVCRQHSYEETCRDAENDANWVRFNVNCSLAITRRQLHDYPLSDYPFPYLDPLNFDAVQSQWVVPEDVTAQEIAAMLDVASDWGKRLPSRILNLRVTKTPPEVPSCSQLLFADLQQRRELAPRQLAPQAGWLSGGVMGAGPYAQLYVTGDGPEGLTKAVNALTHPEILQQTIEGEATIEKQPLEDTARIAPRMGMTTLDEMGIPHLKIAGAFHQYATLYFNRPVNCRLGKESTLKLHFRHAASLDPSRSVVTLSMWIDDKEKERNLASVRLIPENTNNGVIEVHIPMEALERPVWKFTLDCFHEVGAVDCGKTYNDVAWTEIQGDSVLTLVPGRIQGAPYLESFPYFAHADGHLGNLVTCWLPATPTEWQLTTAALMAARAGQTNPTPVRWRVILGGQDTDLATTAGTVIIGTPADVAQLHLKGTALPIIPAGDSFQVAPNCNILGNTLKNKVILQAVPQAANAAGALYAIMAANDRQLVTFCRMLTNTSTMDTLTGNVCLLSPTNIATSLNAGNPVADVQVEQERNRYTLPMLTVAAVIILGLILLLFWFIRLLRGRHGKTRKRAFIPPAQS